MCMNGDMSFGQEPRKGPFGRACPVQPLESPRWTGRYASWSASRHCCGCPALAEGRRADVRVTMTVRSPKRNYLKQAASFGGKQPRG